VVGGITALMAMIPIIHLVLGLVMVFAPETFGKDPPPAFMGWFFVVFAATFILCGWILAGCMVATGNFLARRKNYLFCMVIAGIECLIMPFGTVLGVFTIIVLIQEPVKQLFSTTVRAAQ
jgi:hypothetical protein